MTDGFQIEVDEGSVTVATETFTLVFSKEHVGITSFRYETGGTWHEGVESSTTPPTLLGPYFVVKDLLGEVLYPSGGTDLIVQKALAWFVEIRQCGYMRNPSIPDSVDFPVEIMWRIWPSGRLACRIEMENLSSELQVLLEEAYRLNPADDEDINPGRDGAPVPKWFGFYSNNTGSGSDDLSHDAIVVPFEAGLSRYGESGKVNRLYKELFEWGQVQTIARSFLVALSVHGGWGDCANMTELQARGGELSSDYLNPDPLDGSENAGEVIVGTGGTFGEEIGAYEVTAVSE